MKPTLHILLHPGMGKTATTWTQTAVLPQLTTILNLGKGGGGLGSGDESPLSLELNHLQYLLFLPITNKSSLFERYRISYNDLTEYCDLFTKLVHRYLPLLSEQNDDSARVVVVSDEAITGYGGVQMNIGLIAAMISCISEKLKPWYLVEFHVVMTIREQSSMIQSLFAFDYDELHSRFGPLDDFVEYGLSHSRNDVFGQLFYDELYGMMRYSLDDSVSLRLVPFEKIAKSGTFAFFRDYFHFLDEQHPVIIELRDVSQELDHVQINVNSVVDGGIRMNSALTRGRLVRGVLYSAKRVVDLHRRSPFFRKMLSPIRENLLKAFTAFFDRFGELRQKRSIRVNLSSEEVDKIHALYCGSNKRCDGLLDLELAELGYPCAESEQSTMGVGC